MLRPSMRVARALALLTVMLLAWPAAAFGGTQMLCHMMGRVAASCCCGHAAHEAKPVSSTPELRSRGCCERIAATDRNAIPGIRDVERRIQAPALTATAPIPTALPEPSGRTLQARPFLARAPPPATRLFIKNCSLLS